MQREDTRYRHGDEVGVRPLELECYKIALQLDTDTSNAAQTKEEKKVVEKQVVNNDGGKPLSRSMSRKGLEKAYKEQVAKVEQLEMLLARDANDQVNISLFFLFFRFNFICLGGIWSAIRWFTRKSYQSKISRH